MKLSMNIVFISDDNTAEILLVSLFSLLYNNSQYQLIVYIIDCSISKNNRERLANIARRFGSEIIFLGPSNKLKRLVMPTTNEKNTCAYNTLFLSTLIDEERVLYLDCDTIINGDLQEIYSMDLRGWYLAAVMDTTGKTEREEAGIFGEDFYFNSGVMLCNLKAWRQDNLEDVFEKYMEQHTGRYIFRNQRVMNAVCKDKVLRLNVRYNMLPDYFRFNYFENCIMHQSKNFYSNKELFSARMDPVIVHFAGRQYNRPWYDPCINPAKDFFLKYEKESEISVKRSKYELRMKLQIDRALLEMIPNPVYVVIFATNNLVKRFIRFCRTIILHKQLLLF